MEFKLSIKFIFGSQNGIAVFVLHCDLLLVFKILWRPETTFIVFSAGRIVECRWRSAHTKVKILYKVFALARGDISEDSSHLPEESKN